MKMGIGCSKVYSISSVTNTISWTTYLANRNHISYSLTRPIFVIWTCQDPAWTLMHSMQTSHNSCRSNHSNLPKGSQVPSRITKLMLQWYNNPDMKREQSIKNCAGLHDICNSDTQNSYDNTRHFSLAFNHHNIKTETATIWKQLALFTNSNTEYS